MITLAHDADLTPLVDALRAEELCVVPTDTVYGIACAAHSRAAYAKLATLKDRLGGKPTALLAVSLDSVVEAVLPELLGRAGARAGRLLPGAVTVVVPNPNRRYAWLCGDTPDRIGLRVPELLPGIAVAIDRVGAIAASSANLAGEEPVTDLAELPPEIAAACAIAIDAGRLPGTPSTVVDLTGEEPRLLRAGAISFDEILDRLA